MGSFMGSFVSTEDRQEDPNAPSGHETTQPSDPVTATSVQLQEDANATSSNIGSEQRSGATPSQMDDPDSEDDDDPDYYMDFGSEDEATTSEDEVTESEFESGDSETDAERSEHSETGEQSEHSETEAERSEDSETEAEQSEHFETEAEHSEAEAERSEDSEESVQEAVNKRKKKANKITPPPKRGRPAKRSPSRPARQTKATPRKRKARK